jgi:hypothetical protein
MTINANVALEGAGVTKMNRSVPKSIARDYLAHAAAAAEVSHVVHLREMPGTICRDVGDTGSGSGHGDLSHHNAGSYNNCEFGDEGMHSNENEPSHRWRERARIEMDALPWIRTRPQSGQRLAAAIG